MSNKINEYLESWNVEPQFKTLAHRDIPHWINNQNVTTGSKIPIVEPSTGEVLSETFEAGPDLVSQAIVSAKNALIGEWSLLLDPSNLAASLERERRDGINQIKTVREYLAQIEKAALSLAFNNTGIEI